MGDLQHDDQRIAAVTAARLLISLGWPAVLPLRTGTKWPPPEGFTGRAGRWATDQDHRVWWSEPGNPLRCGGGAGNLALRLPETVVGIDLDLYKPEGLESYRRLVAECGELPQTWVSSSRADRAGSGIQLFRVPAGVRWAERRAGPGIELVHTGHRYVVVPPSIHDKTRAVYRWSGVASFPPALEDLPALPASWGRRLSALPVPARTITLPPVAAGSGYAETSLARAVEELAALRPGGLPGERRNESLNRKAYHLGGIVAAGQLDERRVREELYRAAVANGHVDKHGVRKTLTTIESGLRAGMARPRTGATR